MHDSPLPGDRLREFRRARGMTQEVLAERAGLSLGVVKKIERGGSARIETYHALARALKVRTSALFESGGPHQRRRTNDDNLTLMPLRQAIAPPATFAGRLDTIAADEPDLDQLQRVATDVARAYHRDDYDEVAELLPSLVRSSHVAAAHFSGDREHDRAVRLRANVLQMAGRYLTQVRAYDLAHVALRDAVRDADTVGDRAVVAGAVYQQGWLLMRQGRLDEAEQISAMTAEEIEPRISRASPATLGVWGSSWFTPQPRRPGTTGRARLGSICGWRGRQVRRSAAAGPWRCRPGAGSTGGRSRSRESRTSSSPSARAGCWPCRRGCRRRRGRSCGGIFWTWRRPTRCCGNRMRQPRFWPGCWMRRRSGCGTSGWRRTPSRQH